nr:ATP-binding protein [Butyrivibrio sp. X503]
MKRMIENLITNSVAHNENGCNVTVSLKQEPKGRAVLTVSDDGQGCDDTKLKALNAKLKSDYLPEHGLGIRVVKQVARKYRYKIRFCSEKDGYFRCEVYF